MRLCSEKGELLKLARERLNSWEIRRAVACSRLADRTAGDCALFRFASMAAASKGALVKGYKDLLLRLVGAGAANRGARSKWLDGMKAKQQKGKGGLRYGEQLESGIISETETGMAAGMEMVDVRAGDGVREELGRWGPGARLDARVRGLFHAVLGYRVETEHGEGVGAWRRAVHTANMAHKLTHLMIALVPMQHPDKNPGDELATAAFQYLQGAYQRLTAAVAAGGAA